MKFPFETYSALLMIMGILVGCVITPRVETTVVTGVQSDTRFGGIQCDYRGNAFIYLTNLTMNDLMARAVIVHEEIHVRQAKRHKGGCRGSEIQFVLDAQYRFESELEAHCAGIEFLVANGLDREPLIAQSAVTLSNLRANISTDEILERLECKGGQDGSSTPLPQFR